MLKEQFTQKLKLAWNINVFRHTEWVQTADTNLHYSSQSVIYDGTTV